MLSDYDDVEGTVYAEGEQSGDQSASSSSEIENYSASTSGSKSIEAPSSSTEGSIDQNADQDVIDDGKVAVIIVETDCEISTDLVSTWYDETMEELGGQCQENMDQLEFMACLFEDRCLGGTQDYSDEFKETWGVSVPRCKAIVDAYNAGYITITYENWEEKMQSRLGCPNPTTNEPTQSTEAPTPTPKKTKATACY